MHTSDQVVKIRPYVLHKKTGASQETPGVRYLH